MSPDDLSHDGFASTDLDLLADYIAGVLDPTEAAAVADRLRTDHTLARTHRLLVDAEHLVASDLALLAAQPTPMPADVLARTERTLDRLRPADTPGVVKTAAARTGWLSTGWQRLVAGVGVAAAAAIAGVVGLAAMPNAMKAMNESASDAPGDYAHPASGGDVSGSGAPLATAQPESAKSVPVTIASGKNYDPATLGGARLTQFDGEWDTQSRSAAPLPEPPAAIRDAAAGSALARLTNLKALSDCLAAIATVYPGRAVLLDYARYQNAPALIVVVRSGVTVATVAVGPECGSDGDPHILAAAG